MSTDNSPITISCDRIDTILLDELILLYPDEPYKAVIWNWQFKTRFGRDCLAIVARCNGRLVGFNATMPVQLQIGDKQQDAVWSCDFIVAETFRGKGIGNAIKLEMLKSFDIPIMSMGISDDALPILIKRGWKQDPLVPVLKRIFTPKNLRESLLFLFGQKQRLLNIFKLHKSHEYKTRFFECNNIPEEDAIIRLLSRQKNTQKIGVIKNYAYLQWRYAEFPWPEYSALLIKDNFENPYCLLIYRFISTTDIEIVDFVGDEYNCSAISFAITQLRLRHVNLCSLTCSCSSEQLQKFLGRCGFLKKRYGTRFVYYDPKDEIKSRQWWLVSGDSDGDFLKAAKKKVFDNAVKSAGEIKKNDFSIIRIDEEAFMRSSAEWDKLVANSSCDRLFMSWVWQSSWWLTWKEKLKLELFVHFIYCDNELVGILPLYYQRKSALGIKELQFIGNAWRIAPSVRSEYISPIFIIPFNEELDHHLNNMMKQISRRSSLILPDYVANGAVAFKNFVVRQSDVGYVVDVSGDKGRYIASLGAQTRLKAFNRLVYLEREYPNVTWEVMSINEHTIEEFFTDLNGFHLLRWGKLCFDEYALDFHKKIILNKKNVEPILHRLKIDGRTVSVSYNLICNRKMYNIQSGYLEKYDRKISLGTLHFGKIISLCFERPDVDKLDFLAGLGKYTNYKDHFNGDSVEFQTLQLFPNRVFRRIFLMKRTIKTSLS